MKSIIVKVLVALSVICLSLGVSVACATDIIVINDQTENSMLSVGTFIEATDIATISITDIAIYDEVYRNASGADNDYFVISLHVTNDSINSISLREQITSTCSFRDKFSFSAILYPDLRQFLLAKWICKTDKRDYVLVVNSIDDQWVGNSIFTISDVLDRYEEKFTIDPIALMLSEFKPKETTHWNWTPYGINMEDNKLIYPDYDFVRTEDSMQVGILSSRDYKLAFLMPNAVFQSGEGFQITISFWGTEYIFSYTNP